MAICCCHTVNAQVCIIGRIVDSEQIPIVGVNCVLLNLSDSTLITGATSDLKGRFKTNTEYFREQKSIDTERNSHESR